MLPQTIAEHRGNRKHHNRESAGAPYRYKQFPMGAQFKCAPRSFVIFLDFKNPVTDRWILFLQQRNRDVVHRNPACRLSFQASVVRVPVKHQVGAVAINHFR